MVCSLLAQAGFYGGYFDRIYVISPTVETDPQWQGLDLHKERIYDSYSDQTFDNIVQQAKRDGKQGLYTLIVIDDLAGDDRLYRTDMRSSAMRYTLRARHDNVSMIFVSQSLKLIPRKLRSNLSAWSFFSAPNHEDARDLAKQVDPAVGVDRLIAMISYATSERYSFLQATKDRASGQWTYSTRFSEKLNPAEY